MQEAQQSPRGVHPVGRPAPRRGCGEPSITSADTSSPRCTGRQCRNTASVRGPGHEGGVDGEPAKALRRASASASSPIETQTSVATASAPSTASRGSECHEMFAPANGAGSSAVPRRTTDPQSRGRRPTRPEPASGTRCCRRLPMRGCAPRRTPTSGARSAGPLVPASDGLGCRAGL